MKEEADDLGWTGVPDNPYGLCGRGATLNKRLPQTDKFVTRVEDERGSYLEVDNKTDKQKSILRAFEETVGEKGKKKGTGGRKAEETVGEKKKKKTEF